MLNSLTICGSAPRLSNFSREKVTIIATYQIVMTFYSTQSTELIFFLRELKASAVDLFYLEGVHVDAIQASDIDSRQFCTRLRVRPDCERLNATGCAELVLDRVFVEFELCQVGVAGQKLELSRRRER
jgi:hypothetical protein